MGVFMQEIFFYSREYTGLNQIKAKKKYAILTNILTKYHLKNQKNKFDFFKKVSFRNIWLPFFHKRNLRLLKGFKRNLVSLDGFTKSWAVLIKNTSSFIYYWYNFYISRAAFLKTKNLSFNILNIYLLNLSLLKKKNYLTYYIMLRDKMLFKNTRKKKKVNFHLIFFFYQKETDFYLMK